MIRPDKETCVTKYVAVKSHRGAEECYVEVTRINDAVQRVLIHSGDYSTALLDMEQFKAVLHVLQEINKTL